MAQRIASEDAPLYSRRQIFLASLIGSAVTAFLFGTFIRLASTGGRLTSGQPEPPIYFYFLAYLMLVTICLVPALLLGWTMSRKPIRVAKGIGAGLTLGPYVLMMGIVLSRRIFDFTARPGVAFTGTLVVLGLCALCGLLGACAAWAYLKRVGPNPIAEADIFA